MQNLEQGNEFWRSIKPIENSARDGSLPEVFLPDAATDDDRYYSPFNETVSMRPLWISLQQNQWCGIMYAKSAGLVNRHYHPHQVWGYTISGKWSYLEYDWVASAGDFLYEAPGSAHTLVVHDTGEPMKAFFHVTGPLIWLDEEGEPNGYFDAYDYYAMHKAHYEKVGLGVDLVDQLLR